MSLLERLRQMWSQPVALRPGSKGRDGMNITLRSPWRAVSVVPCEGCCAAARVVAGRRVLCAEAPRLPLPQCSDPAHCLCKYRHHDDRRATPRRAEDAGRVVGGRVSGPPGGVERRRQADRRSE